MGAFRPFLLSFMLVLAGAVVASGCGDEAGEPATESTEARADGSAYPLSVEEALARQAPGEYRIMGYLLSTPEGPRLCDALLESFPPQCGGAYLTVEGLDLQSVTGLTRAPDTDAAWTDFPITLEGSLEGEVFAVTEAPQAPVSGEGNLQLAFAISPPSPVDGRPVHWVFEVSNVGTEPLTLNFSSGQRIEVVLFAEGGEEAYRWSADRAFTQALEDVILEPDSSIPIVRSDELTDLEPGAYLVQASLATSEPDSPVIETTLELLGS